MANALFIWNVLPTLICSKLTQPYQSTPLIGLSPSALDNPLNKAHVFYDERNENQNPVPQDSQLQNFNAFVKNNAATNQFNINLSNTVNNMNNLSQQLQQNSKTQQQIYAQTLNNEAMQKMMRRSMQPKLSDDDKLIYKRHKFKNTAPTIVTIKDKYNQEVLEKVSFVWNIRQSDGPSESIQTWVAPPFSVYNYQSKQHITSNSQFLKQDSTNTQVQQSSMLYPVQQTVIKLQKPQTSGEETFSSLKRHLQSLGWQITSAASQGYYVQNVQIQKQDITFTIPVLDIRLVQSDVSKVKIDEFTIYGLGAQNFYVQMLLSSLSDSSIAAICKKHSLTLISIQNGQFLASGVTSKY